MKFVRICPYCRSKQIQASGAAGVWTGTEVTDYQCNSCGKRFPPFLIIEVEESLAKE